MESHLESDFQSFINFMEEDNDYSEDYSGYNWTDGSPEILFPSWLDSFKETIGDNEFLKDFTYEIVVFQRHQKLVF